MFVMFVAPPGVGKDRAIDPVTEMWKASGKLKVAPTALTHKGLMDELADEKNSRAVQLPDGSIDRFHSLLIAAPELGVILPEYDLGFLSMLNQLFMCYDVFEERIRGRNEPTRITRPHIHFVAGTQPKYLSRFLPAEAFGMGFTARVMFVYASKAKRVSLFSTAQTDQKLWARLVDDLKQIVGLYGEFTFTEEAQAAIEAWHISGCEKDAPTHSRLLNYIPRRILHLLKLCMVFSVSRSNSLQITLEDFEQAHALLLETEELMPQIFREMSSDTNQSQVEEAFNYIAQQYIAHGQRPVPEHRIIHFLSARVPLNQIEAMIEIMINAEMLAVDKSSAQPKGRRLLKPLGLAISEDL